MNRRKFLSMIFGAAVIAMTLPAGAQQQQQQACDDEEVPCPPREDYSYHTYKNGVYKLKTDRHPELASGSTRPVGVALGLVMDTSSSMSEEEYKIEHQATAEALNSPLFRSLIKYKMGENSVAIAVIDFDDQAYYRLPWADIRGNELNDKPYRPGTEETSAAPDKMDRLAAAIATLPRISSGNTNIGSSMQMAIEAFLNTPWKVKEKRVLDIFGDGSSGYVEDMVVNREKLAALGVTINGFAIVNEEPNLEAHYKEKVVTQKFQDGVDGLHSEPGRVWAVARNMQAQGNSQATLTSFYNEVVKGMKQKISVEYTSIQQYNQILAQRGELPDFPVPSPVRR